MLFWVGGYGADLSEMGGRSEGIGTLTAGAMDAAWASGSLSYGRLATRNPSPSPSWLELACRGYVSARARRIASASA